MAYSNDNRNVKFRPRDETILKYYFNDKPDVLLKMNEAEKLDELLDNISSMVQSEGQNVSTSQLRNIFGKIKPIDKINDLKMMRSQLAYISAREKAKAGKFQWKVEQFIGFIDELIKKTNQDTLSGFINFMEAIVAYHKFHHGKRG